jgi:hypothetical protein
MQSFTNAFGWVFFALFRLDFSNSGKEYNRWKALLGLAVLQCLVLVSADLWLEMLSGTGVFLRLPRPAIAATYLVIVLANYFVFLHGDSTDELLDAMAKRPSKIRLVRLAAAWVFMVGVLGVLVFSFWRFSLWAPTHR